MNELNEFGPQPLEEVMAKLQLTSHDLVAASTEQLTFKMVAKGCKGRRLTSNVQNKILAAIKAARPDVRVKLNELFNY